MYPVLLQFEYFDEARVVTSYGIFAIAAILCASLLIIYLARRRGIAGFDTVNMLALLVAGGILFSLISHFLIFLPERLAQKSFFAFPAGLISWGGVLGGFFAALYVSHFWKIPLLKLGDIFIPGVAFGFAIGRVGCHFAGCCFGVHYEGPLALHFSHPFAPAAAALQPLFPIQLLSALLLFLLSGILLLLLRRNLRVGTVLAAYSLLYGIGRFIIENFRADARRVWVGLSDAQWYSLFLVAAGVALFYFLKRKTKESHGY
jgi:phosphatidylglycerol:prolipoprotein diacylglycerol transferase